MRGDSDDEILPHVTRSRSRRSQPTIAPQAPVQPLFNRANGAKMNHPKSFLRCTTGYFPFPNLPPDEGLGITPVDHSLLHCFTLSILDDLLPDYEITESMELYPAYHRVVELVNVPLQGRFLVHFPSDTYIPVAQDDRYAMFIGTFLMQFEELKKLSDRDLNLVSFRDSFRLQWVLRDDPEVIIGNDLPWERLEMTSLFEASSISSDFKDVELSTLSIEANDPGRLSNTLSVSEFRV